MYETAKLTVWPSAARPNPLPFSDGLLFLLLFLLLCVCVCVEILILMGYVGSAQFWYKHQQKNRESTKKKTDDTDAQLYICLRQRGCFYQENSTVFFLPIRTVAELTAPISCR